MKTSGIGGQAVIEGIMMRNQDAYAIAVRKPNQEIVVKIEQVKSGKKQKKFRKIPFIRGIFSFCDALTMGMSTLTYSAGFYETEEEKPNRTQKFLQKIFKDKLEDIMMAFTVVLSFAMAIALFMILPVLVANVLKLFTTSHVIISLVEGLIRLALFIGYVALISLMPDIRRVYMYHGAEHKCINCVEHGLPLTVKNVMASSKEHKRCGTSFMLIVMVLSVAAFILVPVEGLLAKIISRVLLIPVIAGISYEFLRLAGRSDNKIVNALSRPGLMLQHLTTREPDEQMAAVGIAATEAVFDWREFLNHNFGTTYSAEDFPPQEEIITYEEHLQKKNEEHIPA